MYQEALIHSFTDYFTIPVLSRSDNDQEYRCVVVINTTPILTGNDSVVLNVTRKCIKLVYSIMYMRVPYKMSLNRDPFLH